MTPLRRKNFQRLLKPRHIAFIGGRYAIIAINEARRRGFNGEMLAVNPKRSDLAGVPCVASIEALPVAPDAVYLAIPASPHKTLLKLRAKDDCNFHKDPNIFFLPNRDHADA